MLTFTLCIPTRRVVGCSSKPTTRTGNSMLVKGAKLYLLTLDAHLVEL